MRLYLTKKVQGLTLIELLVTISIIMALTMVGVPSYKTFIANERFASATNELYNAYRFTRNEAIKTSRPMTLVSIDSDWAKGWQVIDNGASGAVLLVSKKPHDSITISGAGLTVKSMGSLSGSIQTFTITGADKENCISILTSGQSELKSGSCP